MGEKEPFDDLTETHAKCAECLKKQELDASSTADRKDKVMRKIVVTMFLSLDGVMEGPGWQGKYWNDELAKFKYDELFASDALLIDHETYEECASSWPTKKHAQAITRAFSSLSKPSGFSERMNSLPKYVVSNTLKDAAWNNSKVIDKNVEEALSKLKTKQGKDILVVDSGRLVQPLMRGNFVDEFNLIVYPSILGKGKRLFKAGTAAKSLKLLTATPLKSGVVALKYKVEK